MDNAQLLFKQIVEGGYNGIKSMIGTSEENLFLDFKRKTNPLLDGLKRDDKTTYAKALSGFSNASGGVIVWGIDARKEGNTGPDVAREEQPIAGLKRFLTDLNSLISDALVPVNTGVINREIYINDDPECDKGFIVSYVPASDLPPHRAMCTENIYYTRAGDNFVTMEHYMLEDAFGRRQKPKLKIYYEFREGSMKGNDRSLYILIGIENVGKYLATRPAIRIKLGEDLKITFSSTKFLEYYNLEPIIQYTERNLDSGYFFTGGINDTIHPYTILDVTSLTPTVDWVRREDLLRKTVNDSILSFKFEIFAEGCTPEKGEANITAENIMDFLRI